MASVVATILEFRLTGVRIYLRQWQSFGGVVAFDGGAAVEGAQDL